MVSPDETRLSAWFAQSRRDLPWRDPAAGPWAGLVSEGMLQQTPVARVLPIYREWLDRWPTPAALAAASAGDAIRAWGRLGYPRRALRLHAAAGVIVERHDGRVPVDVEELLALPGVGTYTARAVAAFAHGQRHAVIDTNVRRVVSRWQTGRADATTMLLAVVEALLPPEPEQAVVMSAALMELGALVCTARAPRCEGCPLTGSCAWRAAGQPPLERPRRSQTYAGTDRQARGRLLAALRDAAEPLPRHQLLAEWAPQPQADRALAGLLADGLVQETPDGRLALPG